MSIQGKKRKFPQIQDTGTDVYGDGTVFRDNSEFVTNCAERRTNILFCRPPQLGKTTILSLADLLLNKLKKAPNGLISYPPDGVKNSWYVLSINFGAARYIGNPTTSWEEKAKAIDGFVQQNILWSVQSFLNRHQAVKDQFLNFAGSNLDQMSTGALIQKLAMSISLVARTDSNEDSYGSNPTLVLLIDEYDKPIRDLLFAKIGLETIAGAASAMEEAFGQYVNLFEGIKAASDISEDTKVIAWVTGITPVGLNLISGFRYDDLSFAKSMADAVGLLDSDVQNMLKEAIPGASFDENEQEQVLQTLKERFNNLRFPYGSALYHTGMTNQAMILLKESTTISYWMETLDRRVKAEEIPDCAFDIVTQLVDGQSLTGFSVCSDLSITSLLEQGQQIGANEYLTLLLYLGVVSVSVDDNNKTTFKSTSETYKAKHWNALNRALASSIGDLLKLQSKDDMYSKGEGILLEFLHALSEKRMATLIAWAQSQKGNKILELQLQGNIVETLFQEFRSIFPKVVTTQEDKLASGRSDITITTDDSTVILELKKKDTIVEPTAKDWNEYHKQLRGYVEDHRGKPNNSKWVVGFVLVMYNGGKSYSVQKLANDQ